MGVSPSPPPTTRRHRAGPLPHVPYHFRAGVGAGSGKSLPPLGGLQAGAVGRLAARPENTAPTGCGDGAFGRPRRAVGLSAASQGVRVARRGAAAR